MKPLLTTALLVAACASAGATPGAPPEPPTGAAAAATEDDGGAAKPGGTQGAAEATDAKAPAGSVPDAKRPADDGGAAGPAKGATDSAPTTDPVKPAVGPEVPGVGLPPDQARALYEKLAAEKNQCPNGLPGLAGTWRFIGESKAEAFEDTIAFQGPDFSEWMAEGKGDKRHKAIVTGRYACIHKNRILLQLARVDPDGAFDNHAGDAWACDVLSPIERGDSPRLLLVCFFDWKLDLRNALEFEYERKSD